MVVHWIDATSDSSWMERGEVSWPEMNCRTTGYYWKTGKQALMLMDSLFDDWRAKDGTVGGMSTIPLGMIVSVEKR